MALFDHTKFLFNSSCAPPLPTRLAPQPNSNAHLPGSSEKHLTGNGGKLNTSQAEPVAVSTWAVGQFLSISCEAFILLTRYMGRLHDCFHSSGSFYFCPLSVFGTKWTGKSYQSFFPSIPSLSNGPSVYLPLAVC